MSDPHQTPACRLDTLQANRVDFARRDYEYVRSEDLAVLEPAALIILIERLLNRLDDMLGLIGEVTQPEPPNAP